MKQPLNKKLHFVIICLILLCIISSPLAAASSIEKQSAQETAQTSVSSMGVGLGKTFLLERTITNSGNVAIIIRMGVTNKVTLTSGVSIQNENIFPWRFILSPADQGKFYVYEKNGVRMDRYFYYYLAVGAKQTFTIEVTIPNNLDPRYNGATFSGVIDVVGTQTDDLALKDLFGLPTGWSSLTLPADLSIPYVLPRTESTVAPMWFTSTLTLPFSFVIDYDDSELTYYTVEYYYDGIKDLLNTETISNKTVGDIITTYPDKSGAFVFDHDVNVPLTLGANPANNVIQVYYRSPTKAVNFHIKQVVEDTKPTLVVPKTGYMTVNNGAKFNMFTDPDKEWTDYLLIVNNSNAFYSLAAVIPTYYELSSYTVVKDGTTITPDSSGKYDFGGATNIYITVTIKPVSDDPYYEKPYSWDAFSKNTV